MNLKIVGFFVLSLAVSVIAQAYVPSSKMILSRMVRQNMPKKGVGGLVIDQDVSLGTLLLHEHWIIENAETMKVTVTNAATTTPPFRLDILYRDGKRSLYDAQGQVKTASESSEFVEPYLYFRTSASLIANLQRAKILPPDFSKQMRPPVTDLETYKYTPEPYIQLERVGGLPAYALGAKATESKATAGLWIEQDEFTLRRLRWPSQAEMEITKSASYPAVGLKLPTERIIRWGDNVATLHVVSVKPLKEASTYLSTTGFVAAASEKVASQIPENTPQNDRLKEFYSRFR
jgi:hypothetical protein